MAEISHVIQRDGNGVKPIGWSPDLESCAKEYYAFAKEIDNCPEMEVMSNAANALSRYAMFMLLQNRHKDTLLVPPFDVKVVWLAHMIRVEMYRKDCETAFGKVIDCHVLEDGFRTKASLPQTKELWKAAFSAEYEYQPGLLTPPQPIALIDGKTFKLSIATSDIIADRKWITDLDEVIDNFTDDFVSSCKKAYDMYMYCLYKNYNCTLGPPITVDLIWHAHMCNPVRYGTDCQRLVGRIALHSPWPKEGGDTSAVEDLFEKEFGTSMIAITAPHYFEAPPAAFCSDETPGGPEPSRMDPGLPRSIPVLRKFQVTIHKARDLVSKDRNGFSDPFCVVIPHINGQDMSKQKTKVVKKSLNPEWNQSFSWNSYNVQAGDYFFIQCWDENLIGADFEGEVKIPLQETGAPAIWYNLAARPGKKEVCGGAVLVSLTVEAAKARRMCSVKARDPKAIVKCKVSRTKCDVKAPKLSSPILVNCTVAVAPPRAPIALRLKPDNNRVPVECKIAEPVEEDDPVPVAGHPGVQLCIKDRVCTFAATSHAFVSQAYYKCVTCGYAEGTALCQSCLSKCHSGHVTEPMLYGDCFCDCGAGEASGVKCIAMPRSVRNYQMEMAVD